MASLITFICILILLLVSGMRRSSKISTQSEYLLANKSSGLCALVATLVMTEFNTATLLAFSGAGYYAGLWALWLPAVFLIGLLFYAATVAKKWQSINAISVSALFERRYGKNIARFSSIMLLGAMSGFCATYVKSLTLFFTPFFPNLSPWFISGILLSIILLFTLRGGLVSIIRADITSFALLSLFIPSMLYFVFRNFVHASSSGLFISQGPNILPTKFIISLVVLTMFTYILAPWYGQKIFSAKSPRVAYLSVAIAAVIIFVFYGAALVATSKLSASGVKLDSGDNALPYIFENMLPSWLSGVGYALIFAAGATTLSGVYNAMTAMIVGDFTTYNAAGKITNSVCATLFIAILTWVLGNTLIDEILDNLILANIPVFALSFSLLAGFYWKKANAMSAGVSIFLGFVWGIFSYLYWGNADYTWYWAIYGLPIIFGSGILTTYLSKNSVTLQI